MYRLLLNKIKGKIPKISSTEMIALQSGNVSLDRDILNGTIVYPKKLSHPNKFSHIALDNLLDDFQETKIYPNNTNVIDFLAKEKYFSF